jgi:ATP-dependent Clp protease ATP-binding subunit ClpC
LALEEARTLGHDYVDVEHILLGLIHDSESLAARSLKALGISLDAVGRKVEDVIGRGQRAPSGNPPFTPRVEKLLDLAKRDATALGHDYVGVEDILLGVIREKIGVAAQVLIKLGADVDSVRQQADQLMAKSKNMNK